MIEKKILLEIITPHKIVYKGDVTSFSAPGVVGGFQILYNHAPLMSEIQIGEIKITELSGKEFHYAVSGGFVEVRQNHILVLAETAERSDEIDITRAQAACDRAQKRMLDKNSEVDRIRAKQALYRATNRLRISKFS